MPRKRPAKAIGRKVAKHHLIPIVSRAHIAWSQCGEMALEMWCGHAAAHPGCEHCDTYRAVAQDAWTRARRARAARSRRARVGLALARGPGG